MNNDLYIEFIKKLKEKKSDEEIALFVANLTKFSAGVLYETMLLYLTDEDFAKIEKIEDDDKAQEELKNLFKTRVGVSPEEFVAELRDKVAKDGLFPVLAQGKTS